MRHGQLVFNPGEYVEGYTNFLWTLLMAGVLFVDLDPALWSRVFGIGFAVLTLWCVTHFFKRQSDSRGIVTLIPAVLLAAAPAYACWSTGGLETQMFTTFLTLGWMAYLDSNDVGPKRYVLCGLWLALAAMTRPEGMLVTGILAALHTVDTVVRQRRVVPTPLELKGAMTFLFLFGPYFAWRWWYYGWPLPNTYYVKAGAGSFWDRGWHYFGSWVMDHGLWLAPILMLIALRKHRYVVGVCALVLAAYCLHVIRVGGDFMGLHRFLVPVMPIVAMTMSLGFVTVGRWITASTHKWVAPGLSLVLITVAFMHIQRVDARAMEVGSENGIDRIGWLKMFHGQCAAIGKWLRNDAPSDASIATTAAGIIPYYSRLYTVDILGLNDEWVAHNVPAHGSRPGHTKSAPRDYILRKGVDYLIYHPTITKHPTRVRVQRYPDLAALNYTWKSAKIPDMDPPWWGYWHKERPEK